MFILRACICMAVIFGPGVSFAAEGGNSSLAATEVVVRAHRFDPYRGDQVFSVVDLDRAGLERAPSIDDALKSAAQAQLFRRSSSLTANPTVDGISLRSIGPSGAGRALVTLDGVPQNDPFGGWVIWALMPQEAIDRIHVVRGAGGGAYGAGALTGVIDISLRSPRDHPLYSRVDFGERGNLDVAAGSGVSLGQLGDAALYYNDQTLNGDVPVRAPQRGAADVATSGRDRSFMGNWAVQACPLGVCGEVSALAGHYESRRNTGLAGATALASGDQFSLGFTRRPTPEANGFRLQYWHQASDLTNSSVSVAAGRTSTTLANNQVATPATGDGFNAAIRHQTHQVEWEIGVDGRLNTGRAEEYSKFVAGVPNRFRQAGGTTSDIGLYAEGTRNIDALTLTGALRFDSWRAYGAHRREIDPTDGSVSLDLRPADQSVSLISGRMGASYAVTSGFSLRAVAYTGFRPPSLNELYRPFRVGNNVTEANAALRPETLKGGELGFIATSAPQAPRWQVDMDVFYNVLSQPISNVTIGLGPATYPVAGFIPAGGSLRERQNLGEIDAYGWEAHGYYGLSHSLDLTASATLTHARVQSDTQPQLNGKRPAEAPEYSFSVGAQRRTPRLTLAADIVFEGETFDDDLNTLPLRPYSRLHLQVDYTLTQRISLSLKVNNALDDAIQITRGGDGIIGYDTRRSVSIGLVYRQ